MLRFGWIVVLFMGACVSSQPTDAPLAAGVDASEQRSRPINAATLAMQQSIARVMSPEQQKALLDADVILLGEQHDNPHHHAIQEQVLDLLGQKSLLGSVVFEQVNGEQQPILDALNNRTLGDLAKDLQWASSGWPDYALYEPLFRLATRYKAQLIAGNIAPQKTRLIHQQGYDAVFQKDEQKKLGLDQNFESKAQAALEEEIFVGHCRLLPKNHVQSMIPIQRARDAAMALAWQRRPKTTRTVFIVGSGHARKDFGIPWYLERLQPGLKVYSIGMNEHGADPAGGLYDLVITTEAAKRDDPCLGLKEKFSKPKS